MSNRSIFGLTELSVLHQVCPVTCSVFQQRPDSVVFTSGNRLVPGSHRKPDGPALITRRASLV